MLRLIPCPAIPSSAATPSACFCCLPHRFSSADTAVLLQEAQFGHCNLLSMQVVTQNSSAKQRNIPAQVQT